MRRMKLSKVAACLYFSIVSLACWIPISNAREPLAIIRVAPLRECQADLKAVREALPPEEVGGTQLLGWASEQIERLTRNGLDDSRPLGVAIVSEGEGRMEWVMAVPTTDVFALHEAVKPWIGEISEGENGVVEFALLGRRLYANLGAGWVYVSPKEELVSKVPPSPQPWLEKFDAQWDVAVRINVPQVLSAVGPRLAARVDRMKNAATEQQERHPLVATLLPQILDLSRAVALQTDEIVIGCQVDHEKQTVKWVCRWEASPGSDLARFFTQQQSVTSPLTTLRGWPDAVFTVGWAHTFPVPPESELEKLGQALQRELNRQIERHVRHAEDAELMRNIFAEWLRLAGQWLHQGRSEGIITLVAKPDQLTLLGAKFVGNSEGVEQFVGRAVEVGQTRFPRLFERVTITPGFDRHGEAVIHLMEVDLSEKLSLVQKAVLGEKLEVAFTSAAGYSGVAIGKNAVATLKRAIDDCVTYGDEAGPIWEMKASIEGMTEVCAQLNPESKAVQRILASLKETDKKEMIRALVEARDRALQVTWEGDLRLVRLPRTLRNRPQP